ncbi:MAG: glycosyltransferase family 2 protein [Patescibacteria group bacterium]|jgi:glycosyltransferase involved in cell wall biosynthesis
MKVSVVIPVYNEEKYIKGCLDSLMIQEEKPDEIIVVDNNCTDNTVEIIKKYKNIKIIKETTQGMTPARNTGFNQAKHEIIVKCDADSVLPTDWIKNIKNDFINNPSIIGVSMPIVYSDFQLFGNSTLPFYIYLAIPRLMVGFYYFIGPGYALKEIAWNKTRDEICLNDKEVHEDIDISFHLKKYGKIFHDKKNPVTSSARRIFNDPFSFFGEYIVRFFKMYWKHRHLL